MNVCYTFEIQIPLMTFEVSLYGPYFNTSIFTQGCQISMAVFKNYFFAFIIKDNCFYELVRILAPKWKNTWLILSFVKKNYSFLIILKTTLRRSQSKFYACCNLLDLCWRWRTSVIEFMDYLPFAGCWLIVFWISPNLCFVIQCENEFFLTDKCDLRFFWVFLIYWKYLHQLIWV